MERSPSQVFSRYRTLLFVLPLLVLAACNNIPETTQPTETRLAASFPTETPQAAQAGPSATSPAQEISQVTSTPEPTPTPTRVPEDPWGRLLYSLPELAGPITATNLGIEPLARWGMGDPKSMAFSPDGELLGIETSAGRYIYNAHSLAPIPVEEDLWNKVFPYGSIFITHGQGVMLLYREDELILEVVGAEPYALSPEQRFAAGFDGEQGSATVYSTQDGQVVDVFDMKEVEECLAENWAGEMAPSVSYMAVAESGQTLAISCGDNSELALYSLDGEKRLTFDLEAAGLTNSPHRLQFSPDGSYVAGIGYDDNRVFVWKTDDGSFVSALGGENIPGDITNLSFSPDNSKLLAGFWNGQVALLDLSRPDDLYLLHPESPYTDDLDFSTDGNNLLVPFREHFVILDTATGKILQEVFLDEAFTEYGGCSEFVFTADGSQIICPASRLLVWDTDNLTDPQNAGERGSELKEVPALQAVALIRENLQLLNPEDWKPMDTILLSEQSSGTYDFSPDGKLLALGEYGSVQILSPKEGKKFKGVEELEVENSDLLRFSPDGTRLAVIDEHGLRLFDTKTWEQIGSWDDEFPLVGDNISPGMYELAFSPDGSLLATGSGDDIHLRSAETGKLLIALPGHNDLVSALAFSPDGTLLASLSWDGTLRLWGIPK